MQFKESLGNVQKQKKTINEFGQTKEAAKDVWENSSKNSITPKKTRDKSSRRSWTRKTSKNCLQQNFSNIGNTYGIAQKYNYSYTREMTWITPI